VRRPEPASRCQAAGAVVAVLPLGTTRWQRPSGHATPFSRDLGKVIETYVGELLGRTTPPILIRERPYRTRSGKALTADYVMGLPSLTSWWR